MGITPEVSKRAIKVKIEKYGVIPRVPELQMASSKYISRNLLEGIQGLGLIIETPDGTMSYSSAALDEKSRKMAGDAGDPAVSRLLLMQSLLNLAANKNLVDLDHPVLEVLSNVSVNFVSKHGR